MLPWLWRLSLLPQGKPFLLNSSFVWVLFLSSSGSQGLTLLQLLQISSSMLRIQLYMLDTMLVCVPCITYMTCWRHWQEVEPCLHLLCTRKCDLRWWWPVLLDTSWNVLWKCWSLFYVLISGKKRPCRSSNDRSEDKWILREISFENVKLEQSSWETSSPRIHETQRFSSTLTRACANGTKVKKVWFEVLSAVTMKKTVWDVMHGIVW